jgi:5-dehydro-2-deoxygluconokinase
MGSAGFDVLTMGRIGVDIYPLQAGVGLEDVETFGKYLGGTATNVAVAAARHGRRSAVISRVGDDPFGRYARRALKEFGVDDRYVWPVRGLPTPVTFCEIFPPDNFPIYFYRLPKAPDLEIRAGELDYEAICAARIFWVTGTGLCAEPSRTATLEALRARRRSGITVFDMDYRPVFWRSREEARRWYAEVLPHVTVAVGNADEARTATGESGPRTAARALASFGVGMAVIKQGPGGVYGRDQAGEVTVPPYPVEVVNGLGAGDGFGGALCHGLLAGWPLERTLRFANVAGAIVASRLACSSAMPTTTEVEAALSRASAPGAPNAPHAPDAPEEPHASDVTSAPRTPDVPETPDAPGVAGARGGERAAGAGPAGAGPVGQEGTVSWETGC